MIESTAVIFTLVLCSNGQPPAVPFSLPMPGDDRLVIRQGVCPDGIPPNTHTLKLMTSTDGVSKIVEISTNNQIDFQMLQDGDAVSAPGFIAHPLALRFWKHLNDAYQEVCGARK